MLDDYKNGQVIAYNIMKKEIDNRHISHAYLFDENNNSESFMIIMAFIKEILSCDLSKENKKILCQRIDDGNYPEIKIIEPDGMIIKKQQILDLQLDYSRMAVEGNKRIYIIRDADKMRSETANSMLKFLEEPENNVIAILMTNNFNNLLPTIVSRCQVIKLANNAENIMTDDIDDLIVNFIYNMEKYGIVAIMKEQELLFSKISAKERSKFINVFDKMIDMYYDIVKISTGGTKIKYSQYFDMFNEIVQNNTNEKLLEKIKYLLEAKDKIKNNVNINLLIDSIIVKIGGIK